MDWLNRSAMAGGRVVWLASWRRSSSADANSRAGVCCDFVSASCSCSWDVSLVWRFMFDLGFGLLEKHGESFARAMQLAAHGVRGLLGELRDFVVTHLLIRHQQQQQTVFVGKTVERLLDPLAQFLDLQHPERRVHPRRGVFPDGIIGVGDQIAAMPALPDVVTMVDGDAIKPRP